MGNQESSEGSLLAEDEESAQWAGWGSSEPSKTTTKQPGPLAGLQQSLTRAGQSVGVVKKEPTMEDQLCSICPNLTMQQRLAGFCGCCALGYLLSILGTLCLIGGYTPANVRKFAELYIAGNLIAITATAFFVGPQRLCKRMTAKTRRIGTAVWFTLMVLVFVGAILHWPLEIILACLVGETLAAIWYSASYIPWGRKMIIKCCQASLFSPCPEACAPMAKQV